MSIGIYDTVNRMVRAELTRVRTSALARVTDQHPSDPDNYACTVELRDSGIVLKHVPLLVHKLGMVSIPAVGDLVLVHFVGGDIDAPVILGSLYNDEDRPPENEDGQAILHLPLNASESDAAHVEVGTKDKPVLKISMGSTVVTIQDGDPTISIDAGGNAKLTIGSNGALKIESSGDIELKGSGNVKIEAGGQLTLKGSVVNIN